MYFSGRGVAKDDEAARVWLRTAASRENALAEIGLALACMRRSTQIHDESSVQAALWMRMAAEQGLAAAQYDLGLMYLRGRGVVQSRRDGVRWFRRAAGQGLHEALTKLDDLGA